VEANLKEFKESTMTNKSNTGNSQYASRKSCGFALATALLSMLFFASAAHAQSNCIYSIKDGRWAATCPLTSDSGKVWLLNGSWQAQAYYKILDAQWMNIYYYGPTVWTIQNRYNGQIWVANAAGGWTSYQDYSSQALSVLKILASLAQSQTPSYAPTITIVPASFVNDYCSTIYATQATYAKLGYPKIPISMCGQ
jgi:hypothetical protein